MSLMHLMLSVFICWLYISQFRVAFAPFAGARPTKVLFLFPAHPIKPNDQRSIILNITLQASPRTLLIILSP